MMAALAISKTTAAIATREAETYQLFEAYLNIAEVYIQRAANIGGRRTAVYCPLEAAKLFREKLELQMFTVSPCVGRPNFYIIEW